MLVHWSWINSLCCYVGHDKSNNPVFQRWRSRCKCKLWLRKLCSGLWHSKVSGASIVWLAISAGCIKQCTGWSKWTRTFCYVWTANMSLYDDEDPDLQVVVSTDLTYVLTIVLTIESEIAEVYQLAGICRLTDVSHWVQVLLHITMWSHKTLINLPHWILRDFHYIDGCDVCWWLLWHTIVCYQWRLGVDGQSGMTSKIEIRHHSLNRYVSYRNVKFIPLWWSLWLTDNSWLVSR